MSANESKLEMAKRRVKNARSIVHRHERLVLLRKADGLDTIESEVLLAQLRTSLAIFEENYRLLLEQQ